MIGAISWLKVGSVNVGSAEKPPDSPAAASTAAIKKQLVSFKYRLGEGRFAIRLRTCDSPESMANIRTFMPRMASRKAAELVNRFAFGAIQCSFSLLGGKLSPRLKLPVVILRNCEAEVCGLSSAMEPHLSKQVHHAHCGAWWTLNTKPAATRNVARAVIN